MRNFIGLIFNMFTAKAQRTQRKFMEFLGFEHLISKPARIIQSLAAKTKKQ